MTNLKSASALWNSVADPGFPQGGGANSPGGGEAPTYDFAKFSQKLHEIERIWTRGGPPLDAPLEFILFSYFHPHIRHCRDIRVDSLESSVTTCVHLQRAVSYASCCTRCKRKPVSCSHVVMLSRRM